MTKTKPASWPLLILLLLFSPATIAERGPAVPDYPADPITDNIYVIHGPREFPNPENQGFMNNPGFVITPAGVVIIDPGASVQSGEMVLRMLGMISDKPVVAVFNTHVHGDHWLGNQAIRDAYPEATIYGHPKMLAAIENGDGRAWVEMMERLTEGQTRGTEVVAPNQSIGHGDSIRIGGYTFKVHHYGQAHTLTDIMIEIPEASLVFLGDNALSKRLPRLDDSSVQGNIQTCLRIVETGVQHYVPGHGPSGDQTVPDTYRRYLETLYETVQLYFEEGLSDFEMKDQVYTALAEFHQWPGLEEELGKHISLTYLEIEAAEF